MITLLHIKLLAFLLDFYCDILLLHFIVSEVLHSNTLIQRQSLSHIAILNSLLYAIHSILIMRIIELISSF